MIRIVIDTDILIDHLRGMEKAKEYLREIEEVEVTSKIAWRAGEIKRNYKSRIEQLRKPTKLMLF